MVSFGQDTYERSKGGDVVINAEREAEILRLYYAEKWKIGTIARELGVHKSVVRRVIAQESHAPAVSTRPRKVDAYLPFITETLQKYPRLTASRLYERVRGRGYAGQVSQFRATISELRKRKQPEAFLRLRTLPGEQAQVDWAHFGTLTCGKAQRPLVGFVMVLSYSRAVFLRFFLSQNMSAFLTGHDEAFRWFNGIPRVCLYDNLKSVVLERTGNAIRFNPQFSEYAGYHRFEPRPVAVARGNEKGRTERAIQYIRTSFFAARSFTTLEDLNCQALLWCDTSALDRRWRDDTSRTVRELFLEEKSSLLPLSDNSYPCDDRRDVAVGKSPYVRFDLNDYSVPARVVQSTVTVFASQYTVRIMCGTDCIATHRRSWGRGETIEDERHIAELKALKHKAGQHRRTRLLSETAPSSTVLLQQVAERNQPLHRATALLEELLAAYGAHELEAAIGEALAHNAPNPHAVRLVLERRRQETGRPPALPLPFSDHLAHNVKPVRPHSLTSYDSLMEDTDNDDT